MFFQNHLPTGFFDHPRSSHTLIAHWSPLPNGLPLVLMDVFLTHVRARLLSLSLPGPNEVRGTETRSNGAMLGLRVAIPVAIDGDVAGGRWVVRLL